MVFFSGTSIHKAYRNSGLLIFLLALLSCLLFFRPCASAQFQHRAYYGWIRDLASEGRPNDAWPSIRIDDKLLDDYDDNLKLMHEAGLNELTIWGFFVAREWPLELTNVIDEARKKQVLAIIRKAHQYNIKVLSGMGVYSWGFDAIIRAHPELACPNNPSAMCLHNPESWVWQKKVLDYVFSFPIDGLNLQSADLGRCACGESESMSDLEYHAILNQKIVQYVRQAYPGKIIGISSWGMDVSKPGDLPYLRSMTKDVNYFTDVRGGNVNAREPGFRARMIETIKPCLLSTIGTPNVEPPQHWARDRWFLPSAKRASMDLKVLYRQGGRAVENFMHIRANPGDEATIRLQAFIELHPDADWAAAYKSILAKMFLPISNDITNQLFDLFIESEDAYFENLKNYDPSQADIGLEPLVSDKTGEPVYIFQEMTKEGMNKYLDAVNLLISKSETLQRKVGNKTLMEKVTICLKNTKKDILFSLNK